MSGYGKVLSAALALPLVVGTLWPGVSCGSHRGMGTTGGEAVSGERRAERLAAGVWNGEHVSLEVNEGGATVEFDCAHGSIKQPVVLDAAGRFSVRGTFAFEQGGPATPGARGATGRRATPAGSRGRR